MDYFKMLTFIGIKIFPIVGVIFGFVCPIVRSFVHLFRINNYLSILEYTVSIDMAEYVSTIH